MSSSPAKQINQFRTYVQAQLTFLSVARACEKAEVEDWQKALYDIFIAGICTSYARPFLSGNGSSSLPPQWSVFKLRNMEITHKAILEGRHRAYAHNDSAGINEMFLSPGDTEKKNRLILKIENGQLRMESNLPQWLPEHLHEIRELSTFQADRVGEWIQKRIHYWTSEKDYPDGDYILGENFP